MHHRSVEFMLTWVRTYIQGDGGDVAYQSPRKQSGIADLTYSNSSSSSINNSATSNILMVESGINMRLVPASSYIQCILTYIHTYIHTGNNQFRTIRNSATSC